VPPETLAVSLMALEDGNRIVLAHIVGEALSSGDLPQLDRGILGGGHEVLGVEGRPLGVGDHVSVPIDLLHVLLELLEFVGGEHSDSRGELPGHGVEDTVSGATLVLLVDLGHALDEGIEGLLVLVRVGSEEEL